MSSSSKNSKEDFKEYQGRVRSLSQSSGEDDITAVYTKLGKNYDEMMQVVNYNDPFVLVEAVVNFEEKGLDRENTHFVDFGCGTGVLGRELTKHGFKHFRGIDATQSLADVALAAGFYKDVSVMWVGLNDESFPEKLENSADVVISAGCFMKGHFPCEVLDDIYKCCKHDGLIFFSSRDDEFDDNPSGMNYQIKITEMAEEGKLLR